MAERHELQSATRAGERWRAQLERDHDNLRSALLWLLAAGDVERGQRTAVALGPFWVARGSMAEERTRMAETDAGTLLAFTQVRQQEAACQANAVAACPANAAMEMRW